MKLLIISDVHGNIKPLEKIIDIFENGSFDLLIILGDIYHGYGWWSDSTNERDIANLLSKVVTKLILLKGNCDNMSDDDYSPVGLVENTELMLNGKHLYFAHGHRYFPYGILNEGDIYCHGHTHMGMIAENLKHQYIECNPGSISLPRGKTVASYLVITDNDITLYDMNQMILNNYQIKK